MKRQNELGKKSIDFLSAEILLGDMFEIETFILDRDFKIDLPDEEKFIEMLPKIVNRVHEYFVKRDLYYKSRELI